MTALLLEEMSFRLHPKRSQLVRLFTVAVLESFGYRQLIGLWRFRGLVRWCVRARRHWGEMTRSAALRDHSWGKPRRESRRTPTPKAR